MAKIHISDLQVNSFQEFLETAIKTRNIQGGILSSPTRLGIINWPPITLGIIYSPNGNLS
jgi:hypothetical protein